MLWQPSGDSLFYNGAEFVKSGGLWLPASAAPSPFIGCDLGNASGMTWSAGMYTTSGAWITDPKPVDPEAIVKACEEFSAKFKKKTDDTLFGVPVCYQPSLSWWTDLAAGLLSGVAKWWGILSSLMYVDPPKVSPSLSWWTDLVRGYDIDALPENPRVTLYPHPRDISPARVSEITGGKMA